MRRARVPRRGQSLVEFALFASVLLLLLGAIIDLGVLLSDHLAITYASRQGALAAALAGKNPLADCDALAAVAVATQGLQGLVVTRVVIYEAGADGLPVGGAGSTSLADVYLGNPGCPNAASPPAAQINNWPPAARDTTIYSANSLGLEIDYQYTWQTTIIATGSLAVTDTAVMPLTPGQ